MRRAPAVCRTRCAAAPLAARQPATSQPPRPPPGSPTPAPARCNCDAVSRKAVKNGLKFEVRLTSIGNARWFSEIDPADISPPVRLCCKPTAWLAVMRATASGNMKPTWISLCWNLVCSARTALPARKAPPCQYGSAFGGRCSCGTEISGSVVQNGLAGLYRLHDPCHPQRQLIARHRHQRANRRTRTAPRSPPSPRRAKSWWPRGWGDGRQRASEHPHCSRSANSGRSAPGRALSATPSSRGIVSDRLTVVVQPTSRNSAGPAGDAPGCRSSNAAPQYLAVADARQDPGLIVSSSVVPTMVLSAAGVWAASCRNALVRSSALARGPATATSAQATSAEPNATTAAVADPVS